MASRRKRRCLYPDCDTNTSRRFNRGLCFRCYWYATQLVRLGVTTWAKLEKTGRVAVAKHEGRGMGTSGPPFRRWLLTGKRAKEKTT